MRSSPRRFRRVRFWLLLGVLFAVPRIVHADEPAGAPVLQGVSTEHNLWLLTPSRDGAGKVDLHHHSTEMGGPFIQRQRTLSRAPVALAAWDERLWMVFPPQAFAADATRPVFTLEIVRDPTLGDFSTVPVDRLGVVPPLPGLGRLEGFVGTPAGPVALLMPTRRSIGLARQAAAEQDESRADGSAGSTLAVERPRLLLLQGDSWIDLPLPEQVGPGWSGRVAPPPARSTGPWLLLQAPQRTDETQLFRRDSAGAWTDSSLGLPLDSLRQSTRAAGRLLLIADAASNGSAFTLWYARPGNLVRLADLPIPEESWLVLGLQDGPWLISAAETKDEQRRVTEYRLSRQRIDPVSGALGSAQVLQSAPRGREQMWHLSLLLALLITATMIIIVVRPTLRDSVSLPEEARLLSPLSRSLALLVDLLPGAVLALIFIAPQPEDIVRAPLFTVDPRDSLAFLAAIGITAVHCTISECLSGRTLGKVLVGGRVGHQRGGRPSILQLLVRNLVKPLVLMLPPLVVLTLITPSLQGIHDLAARTVVLGRPESVDGQPLRNDR